MTEKHTLFGVSAERTQKIHAFLDTVQKMTETPETAEILIYNRAQQWTPEECLVAGIHLGICAGTKYAEQQLKRILADINKQISKRKTDDDSTEKPESTDAR